MNNINQEIEDLEATLVSLKAKAKAQEPTLTPVSFKSERELAKALVDGRTFKTSGGITLMYEDNSTWLSPFRTKHAVGYYHYMRGEWNSYDDLQEINASPQPWYLNIPKGGIECYVSDDRPFPYRDGKSGVQRVVKYDTSVRLSFRDSGHIGWKYAIPINQVS